MMLSLYYELSTLRTVVSRAHSWEYQIDLDLELELERWRCVSSFVHFSSPLTSSI